MKFRPLSKDFYSNKYHYKELFRFNNLAVYQKEKVQPVLNPGPSDIEYHTIIIEQRKGYTFNGKYIEPAEVYPIKYGLFVFKNREDAVKKFNELK